MDEDPPERYLCPISRDVMVRPVMVDHGGHVYWFDDKCLAAHARTRYADSNPLTNVKGFRAAPRAWDDSLRDEIRSSRWAPDADDEDVMLVEDTPGQGADVTPGLSDIADIVVPRELEFPGVYNLLVTVDLLPTTFLTSVRHTAASLDEYILNVLDDYVLDAVLLRGTDL